MTMREWMEKAYPESVSEKYIGGVSGCPNHYIFRTVTCPKRKPYIRVDDLCRECWDRAIPESGGADNG